MLVVAIKRVSQRGQTSIFIVLIFNVLFVFFAMVINIGLVIHDKINLQNSVDIAAIYGAQRQAETLNAIAHLNYQIRQSWKLLAWRIRALGDMGRTGHPTGSMFLRNQAWGPVWNRGRGGSGGPNLHPKTVVICIKHPGWSIETGSGNSCKDGTQVNIPPLTVPTLSGFPWDRALVDFIQNTQDQFTSQCRGAGAAAFAMGASWFGMYRESIRNRMQAIYTLSNLLQQDIDISNASISEGVEKTLRLNLTTANVESLSNYKGFNSLQIEGSGPSHFRWFRRILVYPQYYYSDLRPSGGGCRSNVKEMLNYSGNPEAVQLPAETSVFSPQRLEQLKQMLTIGSGSLGDESDLRLPTVGIEKAPWVMIYYGVKAETRPRKPFFPFGKPVRLIAKSFAKPFGGRIGPWMHNQWAKDSVAWPESAGESSGARIDTNYPFYDTAGDPYDSIPNFSLFPGDGFGLVNGLALQAAGSYLKGIRTSKINHLNYISFPAGLRETYLAFNPNIDDASIAVIQNFERTAVAPNVFDLAYYSIQPNFSSYLRKMQASLGEDLVNKLQDIGHIQSSGGDYSIKAQIALTNAGEMRAGYKVNDWQHMLNAWVASGTMSFTEFPENNFAKCNKTIPPEYPGTDGDCIAGGRAGYSVKVVSEEYLRAEIPLGGLSSADVIVNPPPNDF